MPECRPARPGLDALRAARPADIRALYDLAKLTGGGFTNLPADRATLEAKLERSEAGFSREGESQAYFDLFSPNGYALGVNIMIYAMTH